MPWQLSYRGTRKFMAWSGHYFHVKVKRILWKLGLAAPKLFLKWVPVDKDVFPEIRSLIFQLETIWFRLGLLQIASFESY